MNWEALLEKARETGWDALVNYGPGLIKALLTYVIGKWIAKIIRGITRKIMTRAKIDAALVGFVTSIVYAALMLFVIMAALGELGVETTSFAALIAAAGLAVGFALQGSLSNFAAGVMMIMFRPFKIGDFVEAGGVAGSVEEILMFQTIMKTPDNKRIIVPNSAITGGNITNYSANPTRRVDMVFGCGYGDDLRQAKEVLMQILKDHPAVLDDPEPTVAVGELADSSVNFNVRPWVKSADYWTVYWDVHEQVKLKFDEAGVSIPFPQRDVHMHQVA